jgi:uncharacterized protein YehS (DUF1456 family)
MNNNQVLRRVCNAFALDDAQKIAVFAEADCTISHDLLSSWYKQEDDADFVACKDVELASFLNGFINHNRGKKDGPQTEPETELDNNMIFMKLKIALNLKAEDLMLIMGLADNKLSKHEMSAFFRKPGNKHYRECRDDTLSDFLKGMKVFYQA